MSLYKAARKKVQQYNDAEAKSGNGLQRIGKNLTRLARTKREMKSIRKFFEDPRITTPVLRIEGVYQDEIIAVNKKENLIVRMFDDNGMDLIRLKKDRGDKLSISSSDTFGSNIHLREQELSHNKADLYRHAFDALVNLSESHVPGEKLPVADNTSFKSWCRKQPPAPR